MPAGAKSQIVEPYPGAHLIECEINGRPLYLPLLREGPEAMLIDCGTRFHAQDDVPRALTHLGIKREELTWLLITHPDGDHCGGSAEIKRQHPAVRIACGEADRAMIESPDYLYTFRYDAYRQNHGIFFDAKTEQEIRNCSTHPQNVTLTFIGGETFQLGPNRILEIWHLPGHSHGHLGVFDRKHGVLYYGDAIQGAGYRSLAGTWTLCPTYLYVEPYLQTIRTIENSGVKMIVGCHWPIARTPETIRQFCAESRAFVLLADRLTEQYLRNHDSGTSLRELCEKLSSQLGEWPHEVCLELANALSGHLDYGVRSGRFEVDRSRSPFLYRMTAQRRNSIHS
jgi:glyoxylase-like metal-dependent hydrolase (beta-lactamase superfamily II)